MHRCRASHHLSTSRTFCREQGSALSENNSRKLTSNFKCSQDSSWVQICPRDRCLTKWKSTAKIWQELWLTKRWGKVFVLLRQAHLRQPPPTKRCIQLPNESEYIRMAWFCFFHRMSMNLYHVHQLHLWSPRPPSSPFQQLVLYVQHGLHITEHRLRSEAMTLGQEVLKHLRALSAEAKDLELDESSAFHIPSGDKGGTKSSRYLRSLTWGDF